jgi:FixJ family two-component response regulator
LPHKLIIAVIDDDPAIRDALSSLIRSSGYRVRLFASAEQFLRENAALPADCIITDIQMPGMNGLELQRRLRVDAATILECLTDALNPHR